MTTKSISKLNFKKMKKKYIKFQKVKDHMDKFFNFKILL